MIDDAVLHNIFTLVFPFEKFIYFRKYSSFERERMFPIVQQTIRMQVRGARFKSSLLVCRFVRSTTNTLQSPVSTVQLEQIFLCEDKMIVGGSESSEKVWIICWPAAAQIIPVMGTSLTQTWALLTAPRLHGWIFCSISHLYSLLSQQSYQPWSRSMLCRSVCHTFCVTRILLLLLY